MPSRRRISREDIKRAVLADLEIHPGAPVADVVGRVGATEGRVWLAFASLSRDGQIKRHGRGWRATDA